jgi:hypothetical protein
MSFFSKAFHARQVLQHEDVRVVISLGFSRCPAQSLTEFECAGVVEGLVLDII